MGFLNGDGCQRSKSFDLQGILGGDVRATVVSFEGKYDPTRMRFLPSSIGQAQKRLLAKLFSTPGPNRVDKTFYYDLTSGRAFSKGSQAP